MLFIVMTKESKFFDTYKDQDDILENLLQRSMQDLLERDSEEPPDPQLVKDFSSCFLRLLQPYQDEQEIIVRYEKDDFRRLVSAKELRDDVLTFGTDMSKPGQPPFYPHAEFFTIEAGTPEEIEAMKEKVKRYADNVLEQIVSYPDDQRLGIVWTRHAATEGFPEEFVNPKTGKKERRFHPLTAGELRERYRNLSIEGYDIDHLEGGWRVLSDDPEHFDEPNWQEANARAFHEDVKIAAAEGQRRAHAKIAEEEIQRKEMERIKNGLQGVPSSNKGGKKPN